MKINQIISEDIGDVEFQRQNTTVMQTKDKKPVNTNMDDAATPTLVRNKQTKKLEVKNAGEHINKAEFDQVDDTDPRKVQQEMEKQKREQEREARAAEMAAKRQAQQIQQR